MMKAILSFFRQWTLIIAIVSGAVGHSFFSRFAPASIWLLIAMLFLTFTGMSPREVRFHPLHAILLFIQMAGSLLLYLLIAPWSPVLAQCASLCMLTPTGTAAATITGMLGGNIGFLVAYTFLGNFAITIAAPLIIPMIAPGHVDMPFVSSMWAVFMQVAPVMLIPLGLAWGIRYVSPRLCNSIQKWSFLSYYLWALMIMTLIGSTFDMLLAPGEKDYKLEILIALMGVGICAIQFAAGKFIGSAYHRRIAAGQALAQKNLLLAMWLAFQYLDPLVMVCLAAYSIFQNVFNSIQIWFKARRDAHIRELLHASHEARHSRNTK